MTQLQALNPAPSNLASLRHREAPRVRLSTPHRKPNWQDYLLTTFLLTLVLPASAHFSLGSFALTPYRVLLLLAALPCMLLVVWRVVDRLRLYDVLVLAHAAWITIALTANHGVGVGVESGGMFAAEVTGAYFLARVSVRDLWSFRRFVRVLTIIVIGLLVFTLPEALSGNRVLLNLFGGVATDWEGPRLFVYRAAGPFHHPILLGVFCSSALGLYWMSSRARQRTSSRLLIAGGIALSAALSVSSGALMSVIFQSMLIGWERITRRLPRRMLILALILCLLYILIDLASNRDPLSVAISYLTFNPQTGYYRMAIWEHGVAEVIKHPVFGIGFNDWSRPIWMSSSSVDNFWLLTAMRFGLPGLTALICLIVHLCYHVVRLGTSVHLGWTITMCGLIVAAFTVHLWAQLFAFLFCFLGAGVCLTHRDARLGRARPPRSGRRSFLTATGSPATHGS